MSEFISKIDMLKESQREIYPLIEKDKADEFNKRIDAVLNYYQAENSDLQRKLDLVVEALGFYGDTENWNFSPISIYNDQIKIVQKDLERIGAKFCGGKLARHALAQIRG